MNFPTNNILIIAEKPSLALAIAKELPIKYQDKGSYIDCGNFRVAKLAGHVLSLYDPEDYKPSYKQWNLDDLPIVPDQFELKPSKGKEQLIDKIKDLLEWCDEVWNAGDPDREGQMLVDEVLEYLEYTGETKRLLVADTSPKGVQQALQKVVDNGQFFNLFQSAKCRSHSDWLLGINMSRLISILAKQKNYQGVISVGRVQTAILALVVRRYKEIKNFEPVPYYDLELTVNNCKFNLENKLLKDIKFLDDANRIINKHYAQEILYKLINKEVTVKKESKEAEKNHPFCYSLATLQKESADYLGLKASETLEIAQSLYETHKIITYPRSDCKYLPDEQFSDSKNVVEQVLTNLPYLADKRDKIDVNIKSVSWNTKKVTAHFAIIPNSNSVDFDKLTDREKKLYELISLRYIQQFLPKQKYAETTVLLPVNDELQFKASSKDILDEGWNILNYNIVKKKTQAETQKQSLSNFTDGEKILLEQDFLKIAEKLTKPPVLFTESTLLTAINNAKRYLLNKERELENFALGTPATQSSMLDKLLHRNFIAFEGKNYVPTKTGIELINILPDTLTYPDLTVLWEERFAEIEKGDLQSEDFEGKVLTMIQNLTERFKKEGVKISSNIKTVKCPVCKNGLMRKYEGKVKQTGKDYMNYSCMNNDCKATIFNTLLNKKFSAEILEKMLEGGTSNQIKFKNKEGKEFSAKVKIEIDRNDAEHKLKYAFVFDKTKGKKK